MSWKYNNNVLMFSESQPENDICMKDIVNKIIDLIICGHMMPTIAISLMTEQYLEDSYPIYSPNVYTNSSLAGIKVPPTENLRVKINVNNNMCGENNISRQIRDEVTMERLIPNPIRDILSPGNLEYSNGSLNVKTSANVRFLEKNRIYLKNEKKDQEEAILTMLMHNLATEKRHTISQFKTFDLHKSSESNNFFKIVEETSQRLDLTKISADEGLFRRILNALGEGHLKDLNEKIPNVSADNDLKDIKMKRTYLDSDVAFDYLFRKHVECVLPRNFVKEGRLEELVEGFDCILLSFQTFFFSYNNINTQQIAPVTIQYNKETKRFIKCMKSQFRTLFHCPEQKVALLLLKAINEPLDVSKDNFPRTASEMARSEVGSLNFKNYEVKNTCRSIDSSKVRRNDQGLSDEILYPRKLSSRHDLFEKINSLKIEEDGDKTKEGQQNNYLNNHKYANGDVGEQHNCPQESDRYLGCESFICCIFYLEMLNKTDSCIIEDLYNECLDLLILPSTQIEGKVPGNQTSITNRGRTTHTVRRSDNSQFLLIISFLSVFIYISVVIFSVWTSVTKTLI